MPRVPRFSLSQDDNYVYIKISVPYVKISSLEVIADGVEFYFYCKPYLLRLRLPHEVDGEDEECKAQYDPNVDHGTVVATLPKHVKGRFFPDLDMISNLLQQPSSSTSTAAFQAMPGSGSKIQVISSSNDTIAHSDADGSDENEGIEQAITDSLIDDEQHYHNLTNLTTTRYSYGFNNQYNNILLPLQELLTDILSLQTPPDYTSYIDRHNMRIKDEKKRFDPERYLGDYYGIHEDMIYIQAKEYEPYWCIQYKLQQQQHQHSSNILPNNQLEPSEIGHNSDQSIQSILSEQEYEVLCEHIKVKPIHTSILPNTNEEKYIIYNLYDILFAYCYEYRITSGEFTVESASNITLLSSVLSWCDQIHGDYLKENKPKLSGKISGKSENKLEIDQKSSLREIINSICKRSLIYPYIRYYKYTLLILTDISKLLICGKKYILKALLQIKILYVHTHNYYILNQIYINDYCVYIQTLSNSTLASYAKEYNDIVTDMIYNREKAIHALDMRLLELVQWADSHTNNNNTNNNNYSSTAGGDDEEEEEEEEEMRVPAEFYLTYNGPDKGQNYESEGEVHDLAIGTSTVSAAADDGSNDVILLNGHNSDPPSSSTNSSGVLELHDLLSHMKIGR